MNTLLIAFSLLSFASSPQSTAQRSNLGGGSGNYHENSGKACNCGEQSDLTVSLCQTVSVEVSVGGEIVEVTAGLSTSQCFNNIDVPPDHCAYAVYNFRCRHSFWWGWKCNYVSWGLQPLDATTEDCPTP